MESDRGMAGLARCPDAPVLIPGLFRKEPLAFRGSVAGCGQNHPLQNTPPARRCLKRLLNQQEQGNVYEHAYLVHR